MPFPKMQWAWFAEVGRAWAQHNELPVRQRGLYSGACKHHPSARVESRDRSPSDLTQCLRKGEERARKCGGSAMPEGKTSPTDMHTRHLFVNVTQLTDV